ncbi:hypothetical protein HK098_005521, partial [Nowakowskiella sp. JEL0407]
MFPTSAPQNQANPGQLEAAQSQTPSLLSQNDTTQSTYSGGHVYSAVPSQPPTLAPPQPENPFWRKYLILIIIALVVIVGVIIGVIVAATRREDNPVVNINSSLSPSKSLSVPSSIPSTSLRLPNGSPCTSSSQCQNSCYAGICGGLGASCSLNSECSSSNCGNSLCGGQGATCTTSSQCFNSRTCTGGICTSTISIGILKPN